MKRFFIILFCLIFSASLLSCNSKKKTSKYDTSSLETIREEFSEFNNTTFENKYLKDSKILKCTMYITIEDIENNDSFIKKSSELAKKIKEILQKDPFDYNYVCVTFITKENNEILDGSCYDIKTFTENTEVYGHIKKLHKLDELVQEEFEKAKKEGTNEEKEMLQATTQIALKRNNFEDDTSTDLNDWTITKQNNGKYDLWIVVTNSPNNGKIKAIFEWKGNDNDLNLAYLLVNGNEILDNLKKYQPED